VRDGHQGRFGRNFAHFRKADWFPRIWWLPLTTATRI
jgi:hypothetical protein